MKKLLTILSLFALLLGFGNTAQAEEKTGFVNVTVLVENYEPLRESHEKYIDKYKKEHPLVGNKNMDEDEKIREGIFWQMQVSDGGLLKPVLGKIVKETNIRQFVFGPQNTKGYEDLTQDFLQALNEQKSAKQKEAA